MPVAFGGHIGKASVARGVRSRGRPVIFAAAIGQRRVFPEVPECIASSGGTGRMKRRNAYAFRRYTSDGTLSRSASV